MKTLGASGHTAVFWGFKQHARCLEQWLLLHGTQASAEHLLCSNTVGNTSSYPACIVYSVTNTAQKGPRDISEGEENMYRKKSSGQKVPMMKEDYELMPEV